MGSSSGPRVGSRDPGADCGGDLVGDRGEGLAPFLGGRLAVVAGTEQGHLVARGYRGFDRRAVAYGDPESVAEQLSVFGEQGFTDIIIRTMAPLPPDLGADAAARSVELAAEVRSRLA